MVKGAARKTFLSILGQHRTLLREVRSRPEKELTDEPLVSPTAPLALKGGRSPLPVTFLQCESGRGPGFASGPPRAPGPPPPLSRAPGLGARGGRGAGLPPLRAGALLSCPRGAAGGRRALCRRPAGPAPPSPRRRRCRRRPPAPAGPPGLWGRARVPVAGGGGGGAGPSLAVQIKRSPTPSWAPHLRARPAPREGWGWRVGRARGAGGGARWRSVGGRRRGLRPSAQRGPWVRPPRSRDGVCACVAVTAGDFLPRGVGLFSL